MLVMGMAEKSILHASSFERGPAGLANLAALLVENNDRMYDSRLCIVLLLVLLPVKLFRLNPNKPSVQIYACEHR